MNEGVKTNSITGTFFGGRLAFPTQLAILFAIYSSYLILFSYSLEVKFKAFVLINEYYQFQILFK